MSQNIDDKPTLVWESIDDPIARLDETTLMVSDLSDFVKMKITI